MDSSLNTVHVLFLSLCWQEHKSARGRVLEDRGDRNLIHCFALICIALPVSLFQLDTSPLESNQIGDFHAGGMTRPDE